MACLVFGWRDPVCRGVINHTVCVESLLWGTLLPLVCLQALQRSCIGDACLPIIILPNYSHTCETAAMLYCEVLWRLRISREACAGAMHCFAAHQTPLLSKETTRCHYDGLAQLS